MWLAGDFTLFGVRAGSFYRTSRSRRDAAINARCVLILGVCLATAGAGGLQARTSALYREANLLAGWSNVDGWVGEGNSLKNSVGFEYLGKFADEYGDVLTLNVQARVSYDTSGDDGERCALELHNAWVDYKLGLGKTVRVGHFEPAYGLEPAVDTHATLFQTLAMQDIGFKQDWGAGYRSGLGPLDYEVAAGLGSGMGIARHDGSFLLSARIGPPQNRQLQYGVSALYGEVLVGMPDRTIPHPDFSEKAAVRKRLGADAQYFTGPFALKGEITGGRNNGDEVLGGLVQIDYTLPGLQAVTVHAQGWTWTDDAADAHRRSSSLAVGLSHRLTSTLAVRAAVFGDVERPGGRDTRVFAQVYYYGR